jgi:M6 family metalloprotease-like protein
MKLYKMFLSAAAIALLTGCSFFSTKSGTATSQDVSSETGTTATTTKTSSGTATSATSLTTSTATTSSVQTIYVTSISANPATVSLNVGESATLTVSFAPTNYTVTPSYKGSASTYFSFDSSTGKITGLAAGTGTLTLAVTAGYKGTTAPTCAVGVTITNTPQAVITSSKDGSTYGGTTASTVTSGTNYAPVTTSFDYHQLGEHTDQVAYDSLGTNKVLVIPVGVKGYETYRTQANRQRIYNAIFGDASDTIWESLASYYYKSSFQQLLIQGTVTDYFDCGLTPEEIAALTDANAKSAFGNYFEPTWELINRAVAWYKSAYHTSATDYDKDGDGYIDAIYLIYDCPNYTNASYGSSWADTFWAYTTNDYYNVYKASDGASWSGGVAADPTSPVANKYFWCAEDFLDTYYGASQKPDAHTLIHEFGHVMGLDDYYSYDENDSSCTPSNGNWAGSGMGRIDMMDFNIIDHNAFSKFSLGWVKPYLVSGSCTITLKPAATSGECVILPTNGGFNGSFADEYLMLEFYTPESLNKQDSENVYPEWSGVGTHGFTGRGIRLYHVDARLGKYASGSSQYPSSYYDGTGSSYAPLTNNLVGSIANSNSKSRAGFTSGEAYDNRLLTAIDQNHRNFVTDYASQTDGSGNTYYYSKYHADENTLFTQGKTFSFASYQALFPQYYSSANTTPKSLMNDGTAMNYSFTVASVSSTSCTVTITAV